MDLAEFVSDYLALDSVRRKPSLAREIAIAFMEATCDQAVSQDEFHAKVEALIPSVEYYLS